MREKYAEELRKLNANIILMGKMIEVAIESSVLALMSRDCEAADFIIANDDTIDAKKTEIEQQCLSILLQQQPMATDLRLVTAALKLVTDMERIGEHATNIAEWVIFAMTGNLKN